MRVFCSYCGRKLPCSQLECMREWIKDDVEGPTALILNVIVGRIAELERK